MGGYIAAPQQEPEINDNFVFVVPGHLRFSANQIADMQRFGQQPGVPFTINGSQGTTHRPDQRKFKLKFTQNLVSVQKSTITLTPTEYDGMYDLSFMYDSTVPSELIVRLGITDLSDNTKIQFSYIETTWGPFFLEEGTDMKWSSGDLNLYLSEGDLPSRRRKASYANNYDIALSLTPNPSTVRKQSPMKIPVTNEPHVVKAAAVTSTPPIVESIKRKPPPLPTKLSTKSIEMLPVSPEHSNAEARKEEASSIADSDTTSIIGDHVRHLEEMEKLRDRQLSRHRMLKEKMFKLMEDREAKTSDILDEGRIMESQKHMPPTTYPSNESLVVQEPVKVSQPISVITSTELTPAKPTTSPSMESFTELWNGDLALNPEKFLDVMSTGFKQLSDQFVSLGKVYESPESGPGLGAIALPTIESSLQFISNFGSTTPEPVTQSATDTTIGAANNATQENEDFKVEERERSFSNTSYHFTDIYTEENHAETIVGSPKEATQPVVVITKTSEQDMAWRPSRVQSLEDASRPGTKNQPQSMMTTDVSEGNATAKEARSLSIGGSMIPKASKKLSSLMSSAKPSKNQILNEVTYLRATGGSLAGKPLRLRCHLQRVLHSSSVYYVNNVFGIEEDPTNANVVNKPETQKVDEDGNPVKTPTSAGGEDDEEEPVNKEPAITSSGEAATNMDSGNECVICLTDPRTVALYPCRHTCLCLDCANNLSAGGNKCPICRRNVSLLLDLKPGSQAPKPGPILTQLPQQTVPPPPTTMVPLEINLHDMSDEEFLRYVQTRTGTPGRTSRRSVTPADTGLSEVSGPIRSSRHRGVRRTLN